MIDIKHNKKRVFIETYGCQMNEYDTELVRSILQKNGYVLVEREEDADVVLLNTCSVRENANRKVYGRVYEIRHKRVKGKNPVIGILGCMATNLRTTLLEDKGLNIDLIAGPDSYKRLPQLIEEAARTEIRGKGKGEEGREKKEAGRKIFDVTLSEFETYSDVYPAREKGVNAWIAVMRGCNNFCTFCVVPYTRGRERSRTIENILAETRKLATDGFKQVTLLGQNVNSYYADGRDFADLLEAVSGVEGIARVRFISPHPKDFPGKLLEVVAGNPKVCKHIHLPLQAGSDRILRLMDRTYTQKEFLGLVDTIRRACPRIALTTDIIIGFPSETDAEFEETFTVMEQVGFDAAFIFKYSQRQGTIAERKYPDDVPEEVKTERIVRLNDLQKGVSLKKNRAHIGQVQEVLIESRGTKRSAREFQGRNDANTLVTLPGGDYALGEMVQAEITDASAHTLKGVLPIF